MDSNDGSYGHESLHTTSSLPRSMVMRPHQANLFPTARQDRAESEVPESDEGETFEDSRVNEHRLPMNNYNETPPDYPGSPLASNRSPSVSSSSAYDYDPYGYDDLPSEGEGHDIDPELEGQSQWQGQDDTFSVIAEPDTGSLPTWSQLQSQSQSQPGNRKRPLSPTALPDLPIKRQKGLFNPSYLSLLNDDIKDAVDRFVPEPPEYASTLLPSQHGLTDWSVAEKTLLYEALSRLGVDNPAGIAERIGTKSEFEVTDYLSLLQSQDHHQKFLINVTIPDIPAAIELSPALCNALEEAADDVAAQQDEYEEDVEKTRWGDEHWLITSLNRKEIEAAKPQGMLSLDLFSTRMWLRLSERVFMNSAVDEFNWNSMIESLEENPGIRATALEDFYSIAVSVTRRLVAASLYVAESRIKTQVKAYAGLKDSIRYEDVRAAALSIGLKRNSQNFWARCPRRIRLNVYDYDQQFRPEEPMDFDDVEKALGVESDDINVYGEKPPNDDEMEEEDDKTEATAAAEETEIDSEDEDMDPGLFHDNDNASIDLDQRGGGGSESELTVCIDEEEPSSEKKSRRNNAMGSNPAERRAVTREANELMFRSALEYPITRTARDVLRKRIRLEISHEEYADKLDARASYVEEERLWDMLGKTPPVELAKVEVPDNPPKSKKTVDELVRGFSRNPAGYGGGWREKLEVVPSRWEMDYQVANRGRYMGQREGEREKREGTEGTEGTVDYDADQDDF